MFANKASIVIYIFLVGIIYHSNISIAGENSLAYLNSSTAEETYKSFITHIYEESWSNALELCANDIKSEAKNYKSIKEYFTELLPLKEIKNRKDMLSIKIKGKIIRANNFMGVMYGFFYIDTNNTLKHWSCMVIKENHCYAIILFKKE